jgi:hypothetical protein
MQNEPDTLNDLEGKVAELEAELARLKAMMNIELATLRERVTLLLLLASPATNTPATIA